MVNEKIVVSALIVVIVAIFAYYYVTLPQTNKEPERTLEGATELRTVTGMIAEISGENLMLRTNEGVLTIKKTDATRYVALINNVRAAIDENELKQNEQVTVIVGVDSNNKMRALSVIVAR